MEKAERKDNKIETKRTARTPIEDYIKVDRDVKIDIKEDGLVIVEGKFGRLEKRFYDPKISLTYNAEENKIIAKGNKGTKKEKRLIRTFLSNIRNMIKGVDEKHTYKVKVVHTHFPINVQYKDKERELVIKNFFGEKHPRVLKIKEGVDIKINGDIIEITSIDKVLAGNVASDIEQLTRRSGYDIRRFQDGCYIIEKDGKKLV